MSNTVLSFSDFFWIGFIVMVFGSGASYLSTRDRTRLDAIKQQIDDLTKEVRNIRSPSPVPSTPPSSSS
jgi:hypothetical protein